MSASPRLQVVVGTYVDRDALTRICGPAQRCGNGHAAETDYCPQCGSRVAVQTWHEPSELVRRVEQYLTAHGFGRRDPLLQAEYDQDGPGLYVMPGTQWGAIVGIQLAAPWAWELRPGALPVRGRALSGGDFRVARADLTALHNAFEAAEAMARALHLEGPVALWSTASLSW